MIPKSRIPWKLTIALILIMISAIPVGTALANYVKGTKQWFITTLYCEPGACGLVGVNLQSNAGYEHTYITKEERRMGPQDFGGAVWPKQTSCGNSDWMRYATQYVDGDGSVNITGWVAGASICPIDKRCRTWLSNNKYTLYPSPFSGKFNSAIWFGESCTPNASTARTLTISP
jgi:hypothetical protein